MQREEKGKRGERRERGEKGENEKIIERKKR